SSNSYLLSSYLGFMAPMMLTLTGVFLWMQTREAFAVAIMLALYSGYLVVSARLFNRNIYRSISLAIENQQLSMQLGESKSRLEQSVEELQRLSTADALTGVANRRRYEGYIRDAWVGARRGHKPISLLILDIDHFKDYNDAYGHQMGDQCLVRVAEAMAGSVQRETDLVARIGGEEFVIIMPDTNASGALNMAERVHRAIGELKISHRASPVAPYVTVSVGVATAEQVSSSDFSILVTAADHALYEAKEGGRDLVVVGDAALA
ncbi:MAG: diguanylate cyclase, partial [bacterium]